MNILLLILVTTSLVMNYLLYVSPIYSNLIFSEYFFVSNNMQKVFKQGDESFSVFSYSVHVENSKTCQNKVKKVRSSTSSIKICEDETGRIFEKNEDKINFLFEIKNKQFMFYSSHMFNNTNSTSCKYRFLRNNIFGLDREVLELTCKDNVTLKYVKGIGLYNYQDINQEIKLEYITPLTKETNFLPSQNMMKTTIQ